MPWILKIGRFQTSSSRHLFTKQWSTPFWDASVLSRNEKMKLPKTQDDQSWNISSWTGDCCDETTLQDVWILNIYIVASWNKTKAFSVLYIDSSFLATANHFCPWTDKIICCFPSEGRYKGSGSDLIEVAAQQKTFTVSFYRLHEVLLGWVASTHTTWSRLIYTKSVEPNRIKQSFRGKNMKTNRFHTSKKTHTKKNSIHSIATWPYM